MDNPASTKNCERSPSAQVGLSIICLKETAVEVLIKCHVNGRRRRKEKLADLFRY